jgi:hypothetical protein
MWIHRINGTLIFVFTFSWVLQMIAYKGWVIYKDPHPLIGVIILSFVGVIAFGGIFARVMM